MNNRNYYDLYKLYYQKGETKKALFYFEKAAHFSINQTYKLQFLSEYIYLLHGSQDIEKLKYSLTEYSKIDVALETLALEYCGYPYTQNKKQQIEAFNRLLRASNNDLINNVVSIKKCLPGGNRCSSRNG